MKRLIAIAAALLSLCSAASADAILGGLSWDTSSVATLQLNAVVPSGNQPQNVACIICGANQPQQPAGFGYNDFGNTGNATDLQFFSSGVVGDHLAFNTLGATNYSGAFLLAYLASVGAPGFSVGIDINDTNHAQTLSSFYFLNVTQHKVLAAFTTDALVPAINNGTGFPDYTLSGFTLNGINPGDQFAFFSRITNANDGPDSFFLTPSPAAVPGPLVGAGIPGLVAGCLALLAMARRRRLA